MERSRGVEEKELQEEQDLLAVTQGMCLKPGYHDPTFPPHKHGWQRSHQALAAPQEGAPLPPSITFTKGEMGGGLKTIPRP